MLDVAVEAQVLGAAQREARHRYKQSPTPRKPSMRCSNPVL